MMGGFGGFGMGFGIILWLAVIALVVWAVVRFFPNQDRESRGGGSAGEPSEETLRRRFAKGEIDAEQYERSLDVLKGERTKGGV
jgi:putative membrane protein